MERTSKIDEILGSIKSLRASNRSASLPISFMDAGSVCHQPIDPMIFKKGKWTKTPWPGVMVFGIQLTDARVMVMCQVDRQIKMERQEHGPWAETLVMVEGELYEHTTGETYNPGKGRFYKPAGVVHEPEFKKPSVCVITWSR